MPEYILSLPFILVLAIATFTFTKSTALIISTNKDFGRRCKLWLGLTSLLFVSHNMFLYSIFGGLILLLTAANEKNKIALFFFLIFALPSTLTYIPAFGIINFLFAIDEIRLLELIILLPLFFNLIQRKDSIRFFKIPCDKYLSAYLLWTILLLFLASTTTDTLRFTFYVFIDIFLPYYVISRSIKNVQDFNDALFAFVVGCTVQASIGIFEFFKSWLLYNSLGADLGVPSIANGYMLREGSLRVMASTGQPLVFGYIMVVALGFFLIIQKHITNPVIRSLWWVLILGALFAPQSRGPWVGAMVLILVFILTSQQVLKNLTTFAVAGCFTIGLLLATPFGEKVISILPFIGTSQQFNVTYRQMLIEKCITLALNHPIFGVPNVFAELKEMKQGAGIVDIVNTYVSVALGSGLVGLTLFVSFFVTITFGIYHAMRSMENINEELHLIGRVLLATLIAILVMIATVSSISFIPITYWSVAGLGMAYIHIAKRSLLAPVLTNFDLQA